MSRFDDLDRFLTQQQALVTDARQAVIRHIEEERARHDPLIRACFLMLGDYYIKILQPRIDLEVILKKKEEPNVDPKKHEPHYIYMANFIPRTSRPYRDNSDSYNTYWQPDKFGFNDWHPNVAMQFGFYLYDRWNQELKAHTGLEPRIYMYVWGIVPREKDAVVPEGLYLGYDNGWYRDYSIFTIYGNTENPQETVGLFEHALTAATPNVLMHRKHVRG